MTTTRQQDPIAYHRTEWAAFYQEQVDEGLVDPEEQDQIELAEVFWADYEEATSEMQDPTQSIHYSAGVVSLAIEEDQVV